MSLREGNLESEVSRLYQECTLRQHTINRLRLDLAAARAEAERAKALNTRLIRELADKTTPPTDELTGLPTPTPKH